VAPKQTIKKAGAKKKKKAKKHELDIDLVREALVGMHKEGRSVEAIEEALTMMSALRDRNIFSP